MASSEVATRGSRGSVTERLTDWMVNVSPWGCAALWATVLAPGLATGAATGRWVAGAPVLDMQVLTIAAAAWLGLFLPGRLIAPAVQRSMRQHQQSRPQRRQSGGQESSGSGGGDHGPAEID